MTWKTKDDLFLKFMFIPLPITHNSQLVNVILANNFDLKIEPLSGSYKRTVKTETLNIIRIAISPFTLKIYCKCIDNM